MGNVIKDGASFLSHATVSKVLDTSGLQSVSSDIYNVLLGIAVVLAALIGAVIGIKFIVSSVDEKAKIKEALIPYIIGCVVVFGAFTIWSIVINIGNKAESSISVENINTMQIAAISHTTNVDV